MKDPDTVFYPSRYRAYFTTKPLKEQWGDDWDDAPYEHNADPPYDDDGTITVVAYKHPYYETPENYCGYNSPYSVEHINNGNVAWLAARYNDKDHPFPPIYAGTTLSEFIKMITETGGEVFRSEMRN
jgi:hypothetical protein